MELNEKLQELRKQKGMTQEELAEMLHVSRTAVSKWESGRGYPNIDSLKALARFFAVSIDDLLSGEELLTIAEDDRKQTETRSRDIIFGLMDCSQIMLLFLPFFAQRTDGIVRAGSLLSLMHMPGYVKITGFLLIIGIALWGVVQLALQNTLPPFWQNIKHKISLLLHAAGILLFIVSLQPYAAAFLFISLLIKVFFITRQP